MEYQGNSEKSQKKKLFFACLSWNSKVSICFLCIICSRIFHVNQIVKKGRDLEKSVEKRCKGYNWSELMYMLGLYIWHIPWSSFPLSPSMTPWTEIHKSFIIVISTSFSWKHQQNISHNTLDGQFRNWDIPFLVLNKFLIH